VSNLSGITNRLIQLSDKKGYLTYKDINDEVPVDVKPDDLDEIFIKLREHDVMIVEQPDISN
jgi:hypothetical protein